jgi:hypothetical protein
MTAWQKPSFEELTMNAEIGGYSPEDWDGDGHNQAPRASKESAAAGTAAQDG